VAVLALTGCGSGTTDPGIQRDPKIRHALQQLDSVLKAAAAPVRAQPGFKVRPRALQLHGLDLWNAVVDPMLGQLDRGDDTSRARSALNRDQYVVYALFLIDAEIENGGFWQLYFNNSGEFANQAAGLLRAVGARLHAKVLARANRVTWPSGAVPASEAARREDLPDIASRSYDAVDAAWTHADSAEGTLDTTVERYIRAHPAAFFSTG
jgi:hypothetical protein